MDKKPENIGDLGEFFNIIGKAKKQKENEFRSVVGDIDLDGIFDNLKEENKKIKKKKKKEKKQIEQLEKFLFEDVDKKEEPKKEEIPEDQEIPDENTKVGLTEKVEEVEEEIVAEVESQEIQENDHVDEAIKVLDKIVSNKEEISEETDYELIKKEIKELRTLIHRNVNGTSGGGEVRLEFLDDVDRDSAKVNGKFLKYDSSSGKFVGASGGAGSQDLNDTLGIGNTSDIGMSVGVVTATSFVGNGVSLTGIVTSIVAGSNVTISGSTGRVTINASGGGGGGGTGGKFSDDQTNSGIHTTSSNVGLGTTNPRYQLEVGSVGAGGTQLWVNGDARITGILSVGTATITLDPTTNKVQIGTGITIDATTNTIEVAGSKIADTSGNSAFTGIVTAASFVKSGGTSSQFLKADGSVDTSTYSTTTAVGLATAGLASEAFVGLSTAGISTSGLASETFVGLSTFTGDYNNLRNKPTIPTNNNELTNGAGYITGISGIDTTGTSFFNQLNASGVSTFSGDIGSSLIPASDDTYDLGAPNDQWRNLYIDGLANVDQLLCSSNADFFSNVEIGGDLKIADKIVHTGDTDTAIRFPAANTISADTGGAERLRITSSGNIGIGEGNPSAILHVTKAGDPNIIQENSANNSLDRNNTYSFQYSDGEGAFVKATRPSSGSKTDTYLAFGSGGSTERVRIDSSGNVGINSTIPSERLDVGGTIKTEQLNASGVSTFQSHVHLGDDDELRFGANNDFKIVHDPNDCRFENSNGDIKFKNTGSYFFFDEDGGQTLASFINDGGINLFYNGSEKFETTGYGITVFGTTETQQLNVSGVVTATSVDSATLNSVANLNVASNALTIGTSADTVTIAGNLVVSGTETIIDVERLEVGDSNIGIASTTPKLNDSNLDGAGITIYGSEGDKTLKWSNSNSRMEFNTALSASSFATSGAVTAGSLSVSGSYGLSSKYTHQKITSSGSATETLNQSGRTATDIIIFVNGIAFLPTDDYTVSGTTLTFVEAPASSAVISVRYLPT